MLSESPNVDGGFGPLCLGAEGDLFDGTEPLLEGILLCDDVGLFGTGAFADLIGFYALYTLDELNFTFSLMIFYE